jgi:type IV fimbrial biogenesis protein FimT
LTTPTAIAGRIPLGRRARRERGLTLVELMVGVALLAVVLAVAAPEFSRWGRATRVMTHAADLQSALAYARSESSRRGVRVTVCRSSAPMTAAPACDAGATWASGWLVFVDNVHLAGNAAGVVDGADTVLRIGEPALNSVIGTTGNLGAWLAYSPQGLVRSVGGPATGAFTICQAPHGRRISVSPVGLIAMTTEVCA